MVLCLRGDLARKDRHLTGSAFPLMKSDFVVWSSLMFECSKRAMFEIYLRSWMKMFGRERGRKMKGREILNVEFENFGRSETQGYEEF